MKKRYIFLLIVFLLVVAVAGFYARTVVVPKAPVVLKTNSTLRITVPSVGQKISSPLHIQGEAKGWYFEASFPVQILDKNGKVIGQGIAQAETDWMVDAFVPFKGTIDFNAVPGEKGEVVFRKDNPSGLPKNDAEVRVPVTF